MSEIIRDVHAEVLGLADRIHDTLFGMPADEQTEGYRPTEETQADLRRALSLLLEAAELLRLADEREEPIYSAYIDLRADAMVAN